MKKIIAFHGKKKSGKGLAATLVAENYPCEKSEVISFGGPVKEIVGSFLGLDEEVLLTQEGKESFVKDVLLTPSLELKKKIVVLTKPKTVLDNLSYSETEKFRSLLYSLPIDYVDKVVFEMEYLVQFVDDYLIDEVWETMRIRHCLQFFATELIRFLCSNFWVALAEKRVMESDSSLIFIDDVRFPNELNLVLELIHRSGFSGSVIRIDRPQNKSDDSHSSEQLLTHPDMPVVINDSSIEDFNLSLLKNIA